MFKGMKISAALARCGMGGITFESRDGMGTIGQIMGQETAGTGQAVGWESEKRKDGQTTPYDGTVNGGNIKYLRWYGSGIPS
ncbi:MAG: hypothetical protein ABJO88_13790 [Parasphingorhabdus sp.]